MIEEHDSVVLTHDLPDAGLQAGDVGTVVHVHRDGVAYEVEFTSLAGETLCVTTVMAAHLRPVTARDMTHVRELEMA